MGASWRIRLNDQETVAMRGCPLFGKLFLLFLHNTLGALKLLEMTLILYPSWKVVEFGLVWAYFERVIFHSL